MPLDVSHEYVEVNGIRMHYARAGSGPLVVLLHGFPDFWYTWRRQIPALAERFTVVAPDQRGYGDTAKPAWGYDVDVLVADVLGLVDALGFPRAHLVGHDWGAGVAWAAAIARPHRVGRMVAINVPHPTIFAEHLRSNPQQQRRSWYMGFFQLPVLPELAISRRDYALVDSLLRADLRGRISDEEIAAHKDAVSKPGALTGGLNWYRAAARRGMRGLYAGPERRCEVPTLLMYGDRDPFLGVELFEGNERYVSDLRVLPVPGAGHWVHLYDPELVNAELLRFLAG